MLTDDLWGLALWGQYKQMKVFINCETFYLKKVMDTESFHVFKKIAVLYHVILVYIHSVSWLFLKAWKWKQWILHYKSDWI